MVYYTNCCCCFKTKAGVKFIAILGLFINASHILIGHIPYTIYANFLRHGHPQNENEQYGLILKLMNSYSRGFESHDYVSIVGAVSTLIGITCCVLLLYGIHKKRRSFFLPWLVGQMVANLVSVIQIVAFIKLANYLCQLLLSLKRCFVSV